jgi:hypothetical protein
MLPESVKLKACFKPIAKTAQHRAVTVANKSPLDLWG